MWTRRRREQTTGRNVVRGGVRETAHNELGIFCAIGCRANIRQSMISDNIAGGDGGGILVDSGGGVTLNASNISRNTARKDGGGLVRPPSFTL